MSKHDLKLNGQKGGTKGAGAPATRLLARSTMQLMQRMVEHGVAIAETEIEKNVKMAVSIRDDPDAPYRDQIRAMELMHALSSKGVDISMYLDKKQHVAEGGITERQALTVKYENETANRMAEFHDA